MGWAYERRNLNPPSDTATTNQPGSSTAEQTPRRSLYQAIFGGPAKYTCVPDLSPDWDPEAEERMSQPTSTPPTSSVRDLQGLVLSYEERKAHILSLYK